MIIGTCILSSKNEQTQELNVSHVRFDFEVPNDEWEVTCENVDEVC